MHENENATGKPVEEKEETSPYMEMIHCWVAFTVRVKSKLSPHSIWSITFSGPLFDNSWGGNHFGSERNSFWSPNSMRWNFSFHSICESALIFNFLLPVAYSFSDVFDYHYYVLWLKNLYWTSNNKSTYLCFCIVNLEILYSYALDCIWKSIWNSNTR